MNVRDRFARPRQIAVTLVTQLVLWFVWTEVLLQFIHAMLPRLMDAMRGAPIANTPPCNSPDCDFSIFWPAGLIARTGNFAALYQPQAFLAWRHDVLFQGAQRLDWFYPPPSLLPAMAVSYFPFAAAYFVWTLGLAAAGVIVLRWARLPWSVIAVSLLSPAVLWNFEMGQLEFFCGACAVAGLLMLEPAPLRSGALIGLLILKPQAALLAPLAALARRNIPAVLAGLACVAIIAGGVTVLLGIKIWVIFLSLAPSVSAGVLTAAHPIGTERGVSVLWMMRSLGLGLRLADAVQAMVTILAVTLCARLWLGKNFQPVERMALTVFLSLLAVPYGYVDDMVAYSIALAALAQSRGWRVDLLDAIGFLWPALCPIVFDKTGILFTPAIVGLAVIRHWNFTRPFALEPAVAA